MGKHKNKGTLCPEERRHALKDEELTYLGNESDVGDHNGEYNGEYRLVPTNAYYDE